MDDLLAIAKRWSEDNHLARQNFNALAGEMVSAVASGDAHEFSRITERAAQLASDATVNRQEAGNAGTVDGSDRGTSNGASRGDVAEESGG